MPTRSLPLTSILGWCAAVSGSIPKSTIKLAICSTAPRIFRPPGRADAKPRPPVARNHDRAHIRQRPLARRDRVRPPRSWVEHHITPLFIKIPVPGST